MKKLIFILMLVPFVLNGQNLRNINRSVDDTFTGSAHGLEIDFHFQMDTPGSENETSKY